MKATEMTIGTTADIYMFVPLIGALVILGVTILHIYKSRKDGVPIGFGSVIWSVLSIALLVFLSCWCANKLLDVDLLYYMQCTVVISILGAVLARREYTFRKLRALDEKNLPKRALSETIRVARDAALILLGSEFARRALEMPWNSELANIEAKFVTAEFALIACAAFLGYFITQRRSIGPAVVFLACILIGIIEHFVIKFRGTPILIVDLLSIQTAAEVSGGYTYLLDTADITAIMYAGLSLLCASFIRPARTTNYRRAISDVCINIPLALAFALSVSYWVEAVNYREAYATDLHYWNAGNDYFRQGFFPSFFTSIGDLDVQTPEGYNKKTAEDLTKNYADKAKSLPGRAERRTAATAQFNEQKPSIVIVMNEAFADLSRLNNLNAGYEGPVFFKNGLNDAIMRGQIGVSVYGGNTCNSEFECLTGNSLAFVGANHIPYNQFNLNNTPNLAQQLSKLGYQTSAIHPNNPSAWNRRSVYKGMGFDNFYNTENSFNDATHLHAGIADYCTYKEVLNVLQNNPEPQFIYDITIQNHGGYDEVGIPEDRCIAVDTPYVDESYNHQLNTYISCIKAADEDLEWFIGELRNLDRPVILAFFGDHHPFFSDTYNDAIYPEEDKESLEHVARVHQTDYFIWANYDVAGSSALRSNISEDNGDAENVEEEEGLATLFTKGINKVSAPVEEGNEDEDSEESEDGEEEQELVPATYAVRNCGADILGTLVLDIVGAPLEPYQEAQLYTHETLPIICGVGYQDANGVWHAPGTDPEHDPIFHDMSLMDHLRFGSRYTKKTAAQ